MLPAITCAPARNYNVKLPFFDSIGIPALGHGGVPKPISGVIGLLLRNHTLWQFPLRSTYRTCFWFFLAFELLRRLYSPLRHHDAQVAGCRVEHICKVTGGIRRHPFSHNYDITQCLVKMLIRAHLLCSVFRVVPKGRCFATNLTRTPPAIMIKSLLLPSLYTLTHFS